MDWEKGPCWVVRLGLWMEWNGESEGADHKGDMLLGGERGRDGNVHEEKRGI